MATGITGRLIRRTTKEPLQGITIEAVNASTGVSASTTTTTDTKGFFELNGLTSAVYFAKPLVSGDDWDLLPNIAEIYTDEIHVSGSGRLTVDHSFTPTGAEDYALFVNSTPNGASSGTTAYAASGSTITNTATGTVENLYAISGGVIQNAASGAISLAQAVTGDVLDTNSGTITQGIGLGTDDVAGAEAIGVAIGVNPTSGGIAGTTSSKGLYIASPDAGANNYAIYSPTTAQSLFAGSVKSSHATGGIGYATGAGGTVTQLTSKSTGVTLNTISGQITMNNAALGAGALVSFVLTNSAYTTSDTVIAHVSTGGSSASYRAGVLNTGSGAIRLYLENITGGSLSEAVVINFAIIKGATS